MNYELAMELAKAGFPNHGQADRQLCYSNDIPFSYPTLEELIEACGEDFQGLMRVDKEYGGWAACKNLMDANYDKFANGNTPSEAVARLWLALNKKS